MSSKKDRSKDHVIVYGAYGYTGQLIVKEALRTKAFVPIVAGRSEEKCNKFVEELGDASLPKPLVFECTDEKTVVEALDTYPDVKVVLSCAGPFVRTFDAMTDACISTQRHYLDVTGEIDVFEGCAAKAERAKKAGVMLFPGVGFDVVPSDCLAAHLKELLPTATDLELGFCSAGMGLSRGTASTVVLNAGKVGVARRNGKIVEHAYSDRKVPFFKDRTPIHSTAISWGDVSTAYHSTKIPNITVYVASPGGMGWAVWLNSFAPVRWLASLSVTKSLMQLAVPKWGPSDEQRAKASTQFYGIARDANKKLVVESRLRVPEGYTTTYLTAVEITKRTLSGDWKPGFMTPSNAYGDIILHTPGIDTEFDDEPVRKEE